MSKQAQALLLLAAARDLGGLHGWPPAGYLIEAAVDLSRGQGGMSDRECARLRTWARRWQALPPELRAFYASHCTRREVVPALWAILDLRSPPQGYRYALIAQLWEEDRGFWPAVDLTPRII